MRYIGRQISSTFVQVEPDRNSYVNVRSFGAVANDQFFSGRVRGINGEATILTLGEIPNFSSFSKDLFKVNQEIYAFFYLDTATPGNEYKGIFTSADAVAIGNVVNTGLNSKQLQYFVYPYNVITGVFSPYRIDFSVDNVFKDPGSQFDEANYIKLRFNRPDPNWIPIIFRKWGADNIEYLGAPSNNIFGYETDLTFNDTGALQITSWDQEVINSRGSLPEFLDGILSLQTDAIITKTIVSKRRLRIIGSSMTGNIECVDAETNGGLLSDLNNTLLRVKFKFDDTNAVQRAIDFASSNGLKDVFFPSGTYSIRNLKIYDSIDPTKYGGIVLRGSGESSIIKKMSSSVNPVGQYGTIGILGDSSTKRIQGITISKLSFDGNKFDTFSIRPPENDVYGIGDKYNDSIGIEYADSIRIVDCDFYNGIGSAIYGLNAEKINITNCRAYKLSKPYELNVSPVKIRESAKVIVQGNLFENCTGPIDFTGIEGSTINTNIINNCGETGIRLNASDTWSAQGNLAYNENGSIIRSTDLYNNEFSRVSLDIKRGSVMPNIYFTVTDGGLPVNIEPQSISARVYPLTSNYEYNTAETAAYFQVVESNPQLEAGIFALTAPIATINSATGGSNQGKRILGTNEYDLLNTSNQKYGYGYKITATVGIGKFQINKIIWAGASQPEKIKIFLKNSADLLSLFFAGAGSGSDLIKTMGIGVSGSVLEDWPDLISLSVDSIDQENSAIIIDTPASVSELFNDPSDVYSTPSGYLSLVKTNYFIADGNVYVSE